MEFKQLECFIEVSQEESFSKAAENLYMSQPAVSGNIQKLENALNIKLINRNSREFELTESGKLLYVYAKELVNLKNKALLELNLYKNLEFGTLNIYSSTIPARYLLPKLIKEFKTKYKDINCSLHSTDSKKVTDDILSGKINFAFVGSKKDNKKLLYEDFYEDDLLMISSNENNFSSDKCNLNDIKNQTIIVRESGSGTREVLEKALHKKGLSLSYFNDVIVNEDSQSIKQMVKLGFGISFCSILDIEYEIALGLIKSTRIEELDLKRMFSLVSARDRHFSPVETAFKKFILS